MPLLRDIVGHEQILTSLSYALSKNLVNHAYIFSGPMGVGKKTIGLSFARALLCCRGQGDACGECEDCTRTACGLHPDLHIISPEGASIKINQLRALQDVAAFTAFGTGRQVFLLEQAEKMTLAAANCFLKILEEPPAEIVFILVTDDTGGMLPTVLSRCQQYRFNPLSREDVLQVLNNMGDKTCYDINSVRVAAELSGGSPGQALVMLDGLDKRSVMLDILMQIIRERPGNIFLPVNDLDEREDLALFIDHVVLFFRDVLIWQITGTIELILNVDRHSDIIELAGTYVKPEVMDILLTAERASSLLASNVNQRLVLDSLLFRITGQVKD